jgi:hypothetical protein
VILPFPESPIHDGRGGFLLTSSVDRCLHSGN